MLQIHNLLATVGDKSILQSLALASSLTLATLPASAHADEIAQRPVLESKAASGSVTIPDEIAPAAVPYLMCLNNATNEELRKTGKGADAEQTRLIEAHVLQHCRVARETAALKADKLLQVHDKKIEPAARATKIENTLVSIESMFTGIADKMEKMDATPAETEKTNAQN